MLPVFVYINKQVMCFFLWALVLIGTLMKTGLSRASSNVPSGSLLNNLLISWDFWARWARGRLGLLLHEVRYPCRER